EALARQGISTTLVATKGPGTATHQVRELIESGCDLIIAAGGDGTINEVANGMLHTGVPLAILPGGTANVLAREMRLPMSMERVAGRLAEMQPRQIAVGALQMAAERRNFLC